MGKDMLKMLRLVIPGVMILVLILLTPKDNFSALERIPSIKLEPWTFPFIIAVVLGALYYILGIRSWFIKDSLDDIHTNITDKLLEPFQDNPQIACKMFILKKGRTMLQIFYSLIDTNPSLKEKARNVYLNGLIWTSVVDAMAISLFGSVLYFVLLLTTFKIYYLILVLILTSIHLICKGVLLPLITKKHKELGTEQIEFIHVNLRDQLEEKIKKLFKLP